MHFRQLFSKIFPKLSKTAFVCLKMGTQLRISQGSGLTSPSVTESPCDWASFRARDVKGQGIVKDAATLDLNATVETL